jgi:hypothetical protein
MSRLPPPASRFPQQAICKRVQGAFCRFQGGVLSFFYFLFRTILYQTRFRMLAYKTILEFFERFIRPNLRLRVRIVR